MSDEISFEDAWGIKPTQNNSSEISFEDAWGLPKKKEGRGVGGFLKDTAIDATKGVVGFGESAVGLADIATGNIVGKGLAEVGYDPATTKKVLNSGYSPERQLANQNVSDAKGFVPTVKALVENPSTAFGSIVESAPMSLGGAGVARTVGTRMLSSALAKAGIAEGTPAATAFATKFFSNPATLAKLTAVGAGAEGATTTGQIQEQGRQAGKEWSDTILPAAAAGVGTAAIGVLSSKVPGLHDAEAALAIAGRSGERATILQAGKNIAKTMFKEGVLEEMPQSYQEQVFTNLALGRPWDEGAAEAAGQGLVVGAFQGGGMEAGAQAINRASQAKQDESLDPAVRDIEQAFKPKQEVSQVTPGVKSQVIDGPLPVIPQGEGATDVVQNGITTSLQPVNDANSTTLEPESGVNIQSGLIPTTTGVISNALSKGWLPSTVAEEDQGLNEYATQRQAAQDYNQKRNEQSMPTGWAYDSKGEVDNRFTGNEINKQYSTYNPTVPGNEDEAKVDGWIHNSIAAGMTKDEVDEAVARQVSLEYNQRKNAKPDPKLGWLFDNPQDVTNRLIRRRIDDLYETYNPTIPGQSEGAAQPEGNRGWMRDATPQQDAGLNEYRNQANASREYNQERNAKKTGWMQKEAPISKQEFAYDNYNPEIPQTPTVRGWVHTITPTVEPLKNGLVRVKGDKAQIKAQAVAAGIKPVLYGKGGWVFGKKNAEAVKDLFDMKAKMQRGAQIASATNPLKPATVNGSIDIGEGSKTVKKGAQKQYVSVAAMVSENRPAETDLRPLLTGIDSFADTINLSKDKRNGYAKEIINAGTADEAKQTAEAIHAELSLSAEKKGNTTAPQEQKKPAQVEPTKQAKVSPQVAKLQADIADYESMRGRATDTTAIDDAIAEKKAELAQLEKSSKPTIREKLQAKREEKLNKALPTPLSKDEAQLGNAGKMASPGAESFTQQPTQQPTENAVAPVVDEKELERVELIRKWGDKWQYRTYPGKNWYYANSQDGAIEQASKTYNKSPKESLLTPSERYDKTNADSFSEMDKMYGRNSIPELEKLLSDAGKAKAGYNLKEFDQNGGRRTTAAVTNQGIRDAGEFSLKMGIYLKERVEREKAKTTKKLATESEKKPISEMTAATGQDHIADATKMIAAQDHNEQALDMVQRATPSKSVVKDSLATEAIYEKETPEKVAEKIEPKKAGKPQSVYDKIRELSVEEQQAVWTMTLKKGDKFYLGKHSYEVTANTEKTFRVRREDGKNATAKKYGNSRLSGEGLWSSLTRDIEGQITVDLLAQYNQFHKVSDIFRLTEKAIAEYEAGDTFNSIDGIDSELKQFQRETQDNPNDDRNMELVKVAKKFFGTTTDPKRAGYILQDGTMLDFSGAHQVDPASRRYMQDRAVDHRDLHSDSMLTPGVELDIAMSGTWGMMEFMARTGAIRFDYVSGIANAFTDPTAAQVKLIGRHLRGMDITLESVDKETGKIKHSAEIDNATPMKVAKFFADAKTKTVDSQSSYYSIDAPTISDTISQKTHEDVAGITNAYQLLTMAAQNGNAATSALAKLLRKTISDEKLLNTPVSFAKVAHSSYHVSKGITIALKDADALAYNTMLHEAVHGITVKEMKSSPILRMQVKQMMKQVGRKVDAKLLTLAKESEGQSKKFLDKAQGKGFTDEEMATAYALSSPEEFLAQAFSSKSFQELLKSIPSTHSTDSTIKTLWDKLVKFIGKALGITDRNMLSDVIATVVHIGQHEVSVDYKRSGSNLSIDTPEQTAANNYADVIAISGNRKIETLRAVKKVMGQIATGMDKYLGSISTRLNNINPKLKEVMRDLDFNVSTGHKKDIEGVMGMLNKSKKMNREDSIVWDHARRNSDKATITALTKKYHMEAEYAANRKVLKEIREEAIATGHDIGNIDEYAPRRLKDPQGFLEAIGKGPDWPIIETALKARAKKLGITVSQMTVEMKADIISNILQGRIPGLSKPGNIKERSIKHVPAKLAQFYMTSDAALMTYLYEMRKSIEARKFFGKMPAGITKAKNDMHRQQKRLGELLSRPDIDEVKIEEVRAAIAVNRGILTTYKMQRDYSNNIAEYVMDLLESKDIDASQQQALTDILQARFHESGTRGLLQAYKNLSYIDTMGSVTSALTQIGDFGWTAYAYGLPAAIKNVYRAARRDVRVTREMIGMERIAQEFADTDTMSNAVAKVFKWVGLEKMDAIGKESLMNAALEDFEKRAVKSPLKLKMEIRQIFGTETDSVIDDLANKKVTDNVLRLVYGRLLDFQPAAMSEMSEQYLKAGNGRIFYMLKSYTLKQFDVYRNESYNKIKTGEKKQVIEGLRNLAYLSMCLVLANAGADELKDWLLGRDTTLEDRTVDNLLRLFGVSKFVTWKARTEGVGSAVLRQILPPFKLADSLSKDIMSAGDGKGVYSTSSIPLVGKLAYWRIGRGAKSDVERWDGNLAKGRKKLNDIKEKVEEDPTLRIKYREEMMQLRRVNHLQGQLNIKRKAINRLIKIDKQTGRDSSARIEALEENRTNMIKQFLKEE